MCSEQEVVKKVVSFISMKYNIAIVGTTALLWILLFFFSYSSNNNFDIVSTFINYNSFLSLGCIVGAFISTRAESVKVVPYAIIGFILSIFTLVLVKNTTFGVIGVFFFLPLNIFVSLLLIKNVWEAISPLDIQKKTVSASSKKK